MLGFFFRHYDPWVERYVVFDDGSTDGSIDLLDAHPRVERRRLDRSETGSFVLSHRAIQNEVWQESRGDADWVVVTALDEHLWCPQTTMAELLARHAEEGVTAVPALGYQMLADDLPPLGELLCTARTIGAPWPMMNKLSLFRPDALAETYFGPGRHTAAPIGDVRYPRRDELLLLHYKYIGFDRLLRRQALLRTGLGEVDHQRRFGHQYSWGEDQTRAHWEEFAAQAVDIAAPGPDHHTTHPGPRWWRAEAATERA